MKKSIYVLIMALIVGIGAKVEGQTVWPLASGDLSGSSAYAHTSFASGDIIELTDAAGSYTWTTKVSTMNKSLTIRAASNLTTRPVVVLPAGITFYAQNNTAPYSLTFDGIDFNGNNVATILTQAKSNTGGDLTVTMNNCIVRNFLTTTATDNVFNYLATGTGWNTQAKWYGDLNVTNSIFITASNVYNVGTKYGAPNNTNFVNCYFNNMKTNVLKNALGADNTCASFKVDHCTFYDNIVTGMEYNVKATAGGTALITLQNNVFYYSSTAATGGTTNVVAVGLPATTANHTNNAVYYLGTGTTLANKYKTTLMSYVSNNQPTFDANYYVTAPFQTGYQNGGTDGKNLGYYNAALITKTGTFSAFSYSGAGPSAAQSITVAGANLNNNLTVTAPTDYEVCLTEGGTYAASLTIAPTLGTVATTTVWLRLKAGITAPASPAGNVELSSHNATSVNVACTGTVSGGSSPSLSSTQSTRNSLNYVYTYGPSTAQNFDVSGTNLATDITVTPPVSGNFEISNGGAYTTSALTVTNPTTISVRLVAGKSIGSYGPENIAISSGLAPVINVACSGTVASPVVTPSVSTLSGFNYSFANAGPSTEQSFTVSGSNLNASIVITAPTNFEISTTTGGAFAAQSSITLTKDGSNTVASTTIYVRLKASLAAATYSGESITIATNGLTTQNVACSGSVTVPTVTLGRNVITNTYLTYVFGGGPSTGRDCTVSGTNLVGDIVVTCPTNFEIASDAGYATATTGTLTFTNVGGLASGTVYARLKSGLLTDSYTGDVSFASQDAVFTGASTDNLLNLTGSVTGGPVIWGTTANNAITAPAAFSYAGAGPSTSSSNLKITCSGLTSVVTITPSAGFEVSTDNTNFQSTPMAVANDGFGAIAAGTIIYTRMAASLSVGAKTGTITLTATNATTRTVSVSGTVSFSGEVTAPATNISSLTLSPSSQITVAADATLTLDQNTNVSSITVAAGGKLSIPTNGTTVSGTITLQSTAAGTATLVDDYASPTRTATVQQYLSSARNWYFTPALTGVVVPASSTYFGYEEAGDNVDLGATGASAYWKPYATGASLTAGKGYIIQSGGANTISFTNTTVSGDISPVLTYNTGKGNGYNLVGNPYPSYLSWSAVYNYDAANGSTANMPTGTIWYRTVNYNGKSAWTGNTLYNLNEIVYNGVRFYKVVAAGTSAATGGPSGSTAGITDGGVTWDYQGSVYVFATVNAAGQATPSIVNNLIPPMQAFWVKTATGGGTLRFKNSMRSHNTTGETNALKAPKSAVSDMKLIRLNVSNGASTDETVIYASANASNAFDSYDAPKYFNNAGSNQAEIYTQVGSEKLVINAMNELSLGTEIPLGFATEKANNFTLSASEFTNFGSDIKVILKDNQMNTEFDLTAGQSYAFSSAVVNNTNRFSLLLRAPGTSTGLKNTEKLNAQVFVNAANQITIIAPEKCNYAIYNAVGQLIENGTLNSKLQTANCKLQTGIYVVKVNNALSKVIIK